MASIFSRRVVAYLLDFFVLSAFMAIVTFLLSFVIKPYDSFGIYQAFVYIVPILTFIYFVLCEKSQGASIGKSLMYLEVRSLNGAHISWSQAVVRNLTKIYWVPIIFDWLIGRVLGQDRILNVITRTIVVDEFSQTRRY